MNLRYQLHIPLSTKSWFLKSGYSPFGYQRLLVNKSGEPIKVLELGDHKYEKTHRVVLIPGEENDIEIVKRIFDSYVHSADCVRNYRLET